MLAISRYPVTLRPLRCIREDLHCPSMDLLYVHGYEEARLRDALGALWRIFDLYKEALLPHKIANPKYIIQYRTFIWIFLIDIWEITSRLFIKIIHENLGTLFYIIVASANRCYSLFSTEIVITISRLLCLTLDMIVLCLAYPVPFVCTGAC